MSRCFFLPWSIYPIGVSVHTAVKGAIADRSGVVADNYVVGSDNNKYALSSEWNDRSPAAKYGGRNPIHKTLTNPVESRVLQNKHAP